MADHRNRFAGGGPGFHQMLGILVDADGVGVLHAARQDDRVVLLAAGALKGLVDLEVIRRFVVVPAFDLAGLGGEDVDLGAGLLESLLGPVNSTCSKPSVTKMATRLPVREVVINKLLSLREITAEPVLVCPVGLTQSEG